jgi:hypothetical protein
MMIALIMVGFFAGCKKDDTTNNNNNNNNSTDYHVTFKSNGNSVSFTGYNTELGVFSSSGNQYTGVFTGASTTSNIGLSVYDTTAITTKTYSGFQAVTSASATVGTLVTYGDGTGNSYTSQNTNFTITVTTLDSVHVTGTFSGSLKDSNNDSLTITDGDFNVKRL